MRQLLEPHPDSRGLAAAQIEVRVAHSHAGVLELSYVITGTMSDIRMPPVVAASRSDDLWRHTCFEAFVRASSGEEYYEFNFAPSTQWAAYRFDGYRSGMRMASEVSDIPIEVQPNPDRYILQTSLELNRLSALPRNAVWRLGLSALIEDAGGRMSYWALAHPPGKPDFHHADCFVHEFPPDMQR
jgi:hypothetical protein